MPEEPILGNYVRLVPEKPVRMRLTNPRIVERTIKDPKTGRIKTVRALEFDEAKFKRRFISLFESFITA